MANLFSPPLPGSENGVSQKVNTPRYTLRSKRFLVVSEQRRQRNDKERDFRFWPREKWNESQKLKEVGGGGGVARSLTLCSETAWKRLLRKTNPDIVLLCNWARVQIVMIARSIGQ